VSDLVHLPASGLASVSRCSDTIALLRDSTDVAFIKEQHLLYSGMPVTARPARAVG
jgi:hypothetical protein